jgi:hypothetical protein
VLRLHHLAQAHLEDSSFSTENAAQPSVALSRPRAGTRLAPPHITRIKNLAKFFFG